MLADIEMLTQTIHSHGVHVKATERELDRLRAAEARHRLELLGELRSLHSNLANVWDPCFKPVLKHDA